jgi:Kef-type K+ transport system membrane component KefB
MHTDLLLDIAICILSATLFAFVAKLLKQPLILGYIAAGVLVGPRLGLGLIADEQSVETISELGLILLLFMIGLEMDLKKLRRAGTPVISAGVVQFVVCVGLGLLVAPLLGFGYQDGWFEPLYLAIALSLSSTMIVIKLLYDKFELDTLPGRITLGILVVEDIRAILFVAILPTLANPALMALALSLLKGVGLVAVVFAASRWALPLLFRSVAKLPELMLIAVLAWCFGVAMLADWLGLSREMGALLAGVALSTFPYNLDVIAKVISLRDFFITLFFVALGMKVIQPTWELAGLALAASVFLVASRFLSITPVLYWLRQGNRASFVPALNLSQTSEFSLVICALGVAYGHIGEGVLSLVIFTLVITSVTSTWGILRNHEIFLRVNPWLKRLGMHDLDEQEGREELAPKSIVFLGFSYYASSLLHEMQLREPGIGDQVLVVDFNPLVKEELDRRRILAVYGDVSHGGTLHHANVHHARVLLSTIPDPILKGTSNARLLRQLRGMAAESQIIVTAETFAQARQLYAAGASFVFVPRLMGVRELCDMVFAALEGTLEEKRQAANAELEARAEVLP